MKSVLVLIAGALPLALLTASDLRQILAGPAAAPLVAAASPALSADQLAAAEKLAQEAAPPADEGRFYRQCLEVNPFNGDEPAEALAPGASAELQAIQAHWVQWQTARQSALRFADLYREQSAPAAEIENLAAFLKKHPLAGLAGGNDLTELVEGRVRELSSRRQSAETMAEAESAFADAHRNKSFNKWLTQFGKALPAGLDQAQRVKLEALRAQAEFWHYWQKEPGEQIAAKTRLKELESLRQASPPAATEEERAFLQNLDAKIAGLSRQVRLDDFLAEPKTSLDEMLAGCERILADDPAARPALQAALCKLLEANLKERATADIPAQLQEAFYKDRRYVQGVFQRGSSEGAADVWYKYWSTVKAFKAGKPYEKTIYLSSLSGPPQAPIDARVLQEFNSQIRELRKHLDAQADWAKLAELCERLNRELEDYPADRGLGHGPLSFAAEARFCREVLGAWGRVEKILSDS